MDELSKQFIIDMFNDKFEKEIAEIIMSDNSNEEKLMELLKKMEM